MEKIVRILMQRDGVSRSEAEDMVAETRAIIMSSDPFEADQIIADLLGLEPDYIVDLITF